MTDFIDDWLNQLVTGSNTPPQEVTDTQQEEVTSVAVPANMVEPADAEAIPEEEVTTHELSDSDFNDILNDLGFQEAQEAEAEEVTEEEEGSGEEEVNTEETLNLTYNPALEGYDENGGEGRDLDAEEDTDWDALEEAGVITPVDNHNLVGDGILAQMERMTSSVDSNSIAVPSSQEPLLPPNSPTLIMDDTTSRFSGTEWFDEIQKQRIIIAGIGGIGSWLAFNIARLHPKAIFLYDDDVVERVNMSGQLFSMRDVGEYKAQAITKMIKDYTTLSNIYVCRDRFTEDSNTGPVMMCGFDNMHARRLFFERWKALVDIYTLEENKRKCLLLDGRLSIDCLQIFCIRGDDAYNIERYSREFLFDDSEADATVCSMKQTTYLACMIGSLMTNLFVNHVAGLLDPVIPYDLPFFTEYDAQNMIFKTEN